MRKILTRQNATTVLMSLISVLVFVPLVANAAPDCSGGLCDPLGFSGIADFVQKALEAFVVISLPILAFFVVWSGLKFVMARGNTTELNKAKENFMYLIIGAILILGAWALAQLIANTINEIRPR